MNGWVLLHKKIWLNPLLQGNPYALAIWIWLLTHANDKGVVICGRNQVAKETGVKAPTVQYWFKRFLSENYQLTINKTTNKFTEFQICNWSEYQRKAISASSQKLSKNYQPPITNKELRIKNKEINTLLSNDNPEILRIYGLYINSFKKDSKRYRLTAKRKTAIARRLKDAGAEMVAAAIINTASSAFHRGDNDRGWTADLDFILRSYEQVERLANLGSSPSTKSLKEELNDIVI